MVESIGTNAPKKYVVFGATGGTGTEIIKQGLEQGHHLTAYARDPSKLAQFTSNERFKTVKGELEDHAAIEQAVSGQDAVFVCYGGREGLTTTTTICSVGTRAVLAAMKKVGGPQRIAVCSSWGCGPTNRSKLPFFIRMLLYKPLADKDIQEADVEKSGLTYTIARPPRLMDGPRKNHYEARLDQTCPVAQINRADVADFMLKCVNENTFLNQAPAVCDLK